MIPKSSFIFKTPSSTVGSVYDTIQRYKGVLSNEEYDDFGDLSATVTCDTSDLDTLKEVLKDNTRGAMQFLDGDSDGNE